MLSLSLAISLLLLNRVPNFLPMNSDVTFTLNSDSAFVASNLNDRYYDVVSNSYLFIFFSRKD